MGRGHHQPFSRELYNDTSSKVAWSITRAGGGERTIFSNKIALVDKRSGLYCQSLPV